MNSSEQPWTYSLSESHLSRVPNLLERRGFDQIARLIASGMNVLCCHASAISSTEFRRPVYTVQVDYSLFDQFFNSPFGYRGAYFLSPTGGLEANIHFLSTIAPSLLASAASASSGLSLEFIRQSLATPSAKVWLAEHGKEIERKCPTCEGEWSAGTTGPANLPEIRNGRWETATGQKAEWGRKAPYLSKLRVMGAFLDESYNELVPHDKRFRAEEIYRFGWS